MMSGSTKLIQKEALLEKILVVSEDFANLLSESGNLSTKEMEQVNSFITSREELMTHIDTLDAEMKQAGLPLQNTATHKLLAQLKDCQIKLESSLQEKMENIQSKLGKVHFSRRGIKGYYNKQVASVASFVDTKR